jgi:predicted polyphosphate/ATP-dependent NAD kinase
MKIGFVINPLAGIGGSVALKGSDGQEIVQQALARGALPQAQLRAKSALGKVKSWTTSSSDTTIFFTASKDMGEDVLHSLGIDCESIYSADAVTSAEDTKHAIRAFVEKQVDLIIFAGGDGTARDVLDVLDVEGAPLIPVIGIPAGVKIHSAVYATTPERAGELIDLLISGKAMSLVGAQVMDLDEELFRHGKVKAKCYGYLSVPVDDTRMQLIKQGGLNDDEITVQEIANEVIDGMEDDVYYLIGSGSTTAEIMQQLDLQNTLLGIDIVCNQQLIASDVDEKEILNIIENKPAKIVVTIIGGQGHVFGRGNQQLSAKVIKTVIGINTSDNNNDLKRDNIIIIATNNKLQSLDKRPMIADTGDSELNESLVGLYPVITGYQQQTLYTLS